MIVRSDIAKSLEYGSKAQFLEGRESWPIQRSLISSEAVSTGKEEVYVGLGAHPMPVEAVDEVRVRGLTERTITVTNKGWEVTLGVSHDAINDDRVGHVLPWMRSAGMRFEQHMDQRVFKALNGGDSTTYGKCYDTQDFFDSDHADVGADYTTSQDNEGASVLTLDSFNTAWVAAKAFKDDRGEYVNVPYDLLVVPPALKTVAAQICDNEKAYDTGNNEVNPYSGEFRYIVNPELDATAWYITCSLLPSKPIIFQVRQQPELTIWDDENVAFEGGFRYFKWYARYEVGYGDWRLAYQGNT